MALKSDFLGTSVKTIENLCRQLEKVLTPEELEIYLKNKAIKRNTSKKYGRKKRHGKL